RALRAVQDLRVRPGGGDPQARAERTAVPGSLAAHQGRLEHAPAAAPHRGHDVIGARILGTGSFLPGRAVTTAEVVRAAAPDRDPAEIEAKTGIRVRHWAGPEGRVAPIGAEALRRALDAAGLPANALRRIILATSTGGDALVPATANALAL